MNMEKIVIVGGGSFIGNKFNLSKIVYIMI